MKTEKYLTKYYFTHKLSLDTRMKFKNLHETECKNSECEEYESFHNRVFDFSEKLKKKMKNKKVFAPLDMILHRETFNQFNKDQYYASFQKLCNNNNRG